MLYPLKFQPILKPRIWGGNNLNAMLKKNLPQGEVIGESWELSAVAGDESVVANGDLAGNTITELLEIYMDELVGTKVFDRFGFEFPLLFKFIDAADNLSIQVHPNDEIAAEKHNCSGKTEMWYILDAEPDAKLYLGFNEQINAETCADCVRNATLEQRLQAYTPKAGDAFFIPAGLVHALGKGILLAEIQQSSDLTYRLYDYDRRDAHGNPRELHVSAALEAIDFESDFEPKITQNSDEILCSEYFNVNKIAFKGSLQRDYSDRDSFTVLMCVAGAAKIGDLDIIRGETVLLPAELERVVLSTDEEVVFLEVWIDNLDS